MAVTQERNPEDAAACWKADIENLSAELVEYTLIERRLKAEYADAKKAVENVATRLAEIMARGPEELPLFDANRKWEDESWRSVHVKELGLPDAIVNALKEHMLDTIGSIATHSQTGKQLTDVPGIGAAKAEKIEAAIEEWFAKWKAGAADDAERIDDEEEPDSGE